MVLPTGLVLGAATAVTAAMAQNQKNQESTTFETVGNVLNDGSVTGSAGLYKDKDLE